jgi:hypothetical protein
MLKMMLQMYVGENLFITGDVEGVVKGRSVLSMLSRLVLAGGGGGAQAHVYLICVY